MFKSKEKQGIVVNCMTSLTLFVLSFESNNGNEMPLSRPIHLIRVQIAHKRPNSVSLSQNWSLSVQPPSPTREQEKYEDNFLWRILVDRKRHTASEPEYAMYSFQSLPLSPHYTEQISGSDMPEWTLTLLALYSVTPVIVQVERKYCPLPNLVYTSDTRWHTC